MSKNLKEALMSVPKQPDFTIEELAVSGGHWYKKAGLALVASLLLFVGVALFPRQGETTSENYTAAEDVESELHYMVDYFNGEDIDEVLDDYALSSDF